MANVHSIPERRIARLQCTFCLLNPGLIGAREGNGFCRQSYRKSRTLRVGPCQGERPAMRFGNPLGNGETQSGTTCPSRRRVAAGARLVGAKESFEDARLKFLRN